MDETKEVIELHALNYKIFRLSLPLTHTLAHPQRVIKVGGVRETE